jgi:hypothetical protein
MLSAARLKENFEPLPHSCCPGEGQGFPDVSLRKTTMVCRLTKKWAFVTTTQTCSLPNARFESCSARSDKQQDRFRR